MKMEKRMRSDDMIIASGHFLKEEKYWLDQLKGELVKTTFPYDSKKTVKNREDPVSKQQIETFTFSLAEKLCTRLIELSNKSDSRLFMILTAGLAVLLEKYSGHRDIILGTTIEKQEIKAELVNTILPLRIQIKGDITFKDLLIQVRQTVIDANENQNYPILITIEQLDIPSTGNNFPLFDISISLENIHDKKYLQHITTNMDFSFSRTNDILDGIVYYNSSLYEKKSIEGIVDHFIILLEQVLFDVRSRLSEINIISEDEKQMLLYYYNDTKTGYPKNKKIHELFEDQVEKKPGHIALVYKNSQLTYQELNQKANQLARILREKGVKPDIIVGLLLERLTYVIVGLLGILKAGGAYLSIDHHHPLERISYMLADSSAKILGNTRISTQEGEKRRREEYKKIGRWQGEVILLNELLTAFNKVPSSKTGLACSPALETPAGKQQSADNLAYVIYTSGTTGKPKGVMVKHRNISRLVKNTNFIEFAPEDRILQGGALDFDASTFEIWGALLNGLTLYLAPKDKLLNPGTLKKIIALNHITIIWMTSALFNQMVQSDLEIFAGLRNLLVGGDVLSPFHINQVKKRFPRLNIINGYGPTENTTFSTTLLIDREYKESIPIGKPIANSTAYILDQNGKTQPIGIMGELYVGGDGVARGYLNNPGLTREKFIDNPYILGEGLYKTGDLARWRPDGNIDFLGRIDQQVKIRGFRIEPGEIESQLLKKDGIRDVVIVAKENENKKGGKQLCAYITSNQELNISQLREWLLKNLPDYMVPAYFMQLEKLPLTPNGKIDRKALPEPEIKTETDYEAPREEIEKNMADVWHEVLGLKKIGINDNFFVMGGDSIKAIQIASRLQKYGLKIDTRDLFNNSTIKTLAAYVKEFDNKADQGIISGKVHLTAIQKWFFQKNFTNRHHFNHSVMLYSENGFAEEAIKTVFNKIIRHHDALRMRYITEGNQIVQVNHGTNGSMFDLEILDLHNENIENIERKIKNVCSRIQSGIQLSSGPLVKLGLFKTRQGDHLLIVVHHLVIDGVSWRILFEDFATGYRQFRQGEEIEFPPKTYSFKYWAEKITGYAQSREILRELDYWKKLEENKLENLPKDYQIGKEYKKYKYFETTTMKLDKGTTEKLLREINHAYNTDINDIFLTALGLTVQEWAGIEKVLVNLEGHGREPIIEDIDISRTIGWFTSQFPVLLDVSAAPKKNEEEKLSHCIKFVKETLKQVPDNGFGHSILKHITPVEKRERVNFLLETGINFNYLGEFGQESNTDNGLFRISPMSNIKGDSISPEAENNITIDISGVIVGGMLSIRFSYNKYEYEETSIKKFVNCFQSNLFKIIDHCVRKEENEFTPSDFTKKDLEIEELENVLDMVRDI